MKSFATILLTAGLASANLLAPIANRDSNSILGNLDSGLNLEDIEASSLDLGGLGNLDIGGLNLGSIDLSNNDDVANAILELLGGWCLGNIFSLSSLLSLGSNSDVMMLIEIAELAQLEQLGFLNVGDIQSLFSSGSLDSGFNVGVFKRAIEERKKTLKRTKLRRTPGKRQTQCSSSPDVVVEGGSTVTTQVTATAVAQATTAAAATEATSTTAVDSAASQATASATASDSTPSATASSSDPAASEPLSDFTR